MQTRGQFGSLPVVAPVVIMYLGFLASNLVLGGQALHARFEVIGRHPSAITVGQTLIPVWSAQAGWCALIALALFGQDNMVN